MFCTTIVLVCGVAVCCWSIQPITATTGFHCMSRVFRPPATHLILSQLTILIESISTSKRFYIYSCSQSNAIVRTFAALTLSSISRKQMSDVAPSRMSSVLPLGEPLRAYAFLCVAFYCPIICRYRLTSSPKPEIRAGPSHGRI